ncbi:MAG: cation:proton antiporter [Bacilli bacterium]
MLLDFLTSFPSTSENLEPFKLLLPLGLILIFAKVFSLLLNKAHLPQVVGFLISGLVVGAIGFIPNQTVLTSNTMIGLSYFAKIGVVLILFTAGVETDIKKVKAEGVASVVITSLGVLIPLALGFLVAFLFRTFGGLDTDFYKAMTEKGINPIYSDIYYGVILSATSVSITVATLKELGRLDSRVGTALVSAAILDDIIGIILLSLVISLANGNQTGGGEDFVSMIMNATGSTNAALNIFLIVLFMLIFFALTFVLGIVLKKFFNFLGNKYPHHIRITILSLGFCFLWSYLAEFFNIADITGAYLMGLIFAGTTPADYIDHRAETTNNYIFAPVFFASIAMEMYQTKFDSSFLAFLGFGLVWVVVGLAGKVLGAGAGAMMSKFKFKDSLRIGIGMMARAEVLIVCAQKGVEAGLVSSQIMPFTLILILISSFLTPILLKVLYKGEPPEEKISLKTDISTPVKTA